jgi:hypothetical protein
MLGCPRAAFDDDLRTNAGLEVERFAAEPTRVTAAARSHCPVPS